MIDRRTEYVWIRRTWKRVAENVVRATGYDSKLVDAEARDRPKKCSCGNTMPFYKWQPKKADYTGMDIACPKCRANYAIALYPEGCIYHELP